MKKTLLLSGLLIIYLIESLTVTAQNVGIGTGTPNSSALLDVNSTTQGLLIPCMTTTQMNAIALPALSLLLYNTTTNCYMFYNGATWQTIVCQCPGAPNPGTVSGLDSACAPASGYSYKVTFVNGVTYIWTVPAGASITAGQGTNSITVNFSSAVSDNISVTGYNSCGTGLTSYLPVNISSAIPETPSISGFTQTGISTSQSYSVNNPQSGVTYTWSITGSATITSPGNTVTATFPASPSTYTITVVAINGCGTASSTLVVTTASITHGIIIFNYTGSTQTYQLPAGVNNVEVKMWGAGGGCGTVGTGAAASPYAACAGTGGFISGVFAVNGGTTLYILVGGGGSSTSGVSAFPDGGVTSYFPYAGGGGGRSAIQITLGADFISSGGGGGGGYGASVSAASPYCTFGCGGGAGNGITPNNGLDGGYCPIDFGSGGISTAGGLAGTGCSVNYSGANGTQYQGGNGNSAHFDQAGGAGGDGYFGGGAGNNYLGGGGGGGSNYPIVSSAQFNLTSDLAGNTPVQGTAYLSGLTPPNSSDVNYQTGTGIAETKAAGGPGEIVIIY